MSIFLTTFIFSFISRPRARSGDFFSRALPLTISFTCAAGSPAPQAEKFSLSVHLWVKLQATQVNLPHAFQCTCLPDQGLTWLVSASLRHFLTVQHSSSTKIFTLPPSSSHSALIWCLGTHIPQLVGAWWLLHRFAGHQPSSGLAAMLLSIITNTILKTKIL